METRLTLYLFTATTVLIGVVLRLLLPIMGHNNDVEAYRIVADIVERGGNVYAETDRYNYGPIWFYILHLLDILPCLSLSKLIALRWKVAFFVTMVDIGIFVILFRFYGSKIAALFILNPISILITGYHSQFDNLAILLGMLSVTTIESDRNIFKLYSGLVLLGLSLSVKHILFVFPVWLAFREKCWHRKLLTILMPYLIFMSGFIFYISDGMHGILKNVFYYRSFNNAPFWSVITPYILFDKIPSIFLFIATLLILGLIWRQKKLIDMFHLYTISLIIFSSAIANQYLTICIPSISTQMNWAYFAYTLFGSYVISVASDGLNIMSLPLYKLVNSISIYHWYQLLIAFLLLGLIKNQLVEHKLNIIVDTINSGIMWLYKEVLNQLKAPWKL